MPRRKYDKAHKDWAKAVKERDGNQCVVCGEKKSICAHHLIPWEIEKYRFDINNGISLCFKHHTRYSYGLSPHSDGAALFFFWLFENRPDTYKWLKENFKDVAS
jgi:hypothetical protein